MSNVFLRKQFSTYLGENRAIDDIIVRYVADISPSPTPTPVPLTPTPTPSSSPIPPTPTPTITSTPTTTSTPTNTPTQTRTPNATATPTITPTQTQTPSSTPAVPYNTGIIVEDSSGGIYTAGVSVVVNGNTIPIISTGGTIGNGGCVNVLVRDNTALQYIINYGGGFTGSTLPGQVYNEVRCINFLYNPLLGVYGGYDYTEVLYLNNTPVSSSVKQTLIVNPPADLGYGCNLQDLDLFVKFWITGGIVPTPTPTLTPTTTQGITPTPTPSVTATLSPTPTITPTNTATPTNTPTSSLTPTPSVSPTNTLTPTPSVSPSATPTITPTNTGTPTNTPTNTLTPSPTPSSDAAGYKLQAENADFLQTESGDEINIEH